MGVPAGEILGWLAEGDIEQVGALAGSHGEDPVFTVAPRLRDALSDRLARIGKTAVVLSPLRVRSFLLRSLLHGAHPPLDTGTDLPTRSVTSEVPGEALAQHLLTTDLAQVLHEAAADLDADVAAMLRLAQEEARLELAKAAEGTDASPAEEPPAYVDEPATDEDGAVETEECFDVDDLRELLGDFEDEPEPGEAASDLREDDAIPPPAPADAQVSPEVEPSRNEPILDTTSPSAADPGQEFTMPSTHHAHPEDALEPAHGEASVEPTPVAAHTESEKAEQPEPSAATIEADERAALTEAAAVLEQLLGDEPPSTPFLEPSEIQSALAALDIDEPAPTRRAAAPQEMPFAADAPVAEATSMPTFEPKADAPEAETRDQAIAKHEARSEPANASGAADHEVGSAVGGLADAEFAETSVAAAIDTASAKAIESPAGGGSAPRVARSAEVADTSTTDDAAPRVAATTTMPMAGAAAEPAGSSRSAVPAPSAGTPATAGGEHEVLGAAMQRVDAFLDRLKAALVEMAARPAAPAPAPLPAPAAPPLDVAPLVGAIDGGFAKAVQQSEAAAHALTGLAERIDGLGQRLEASTGATVAALQAAPATNARPTAPQFVMPRSSVVPWVLLAVAGLVTAWSVLFWFKTGSPRLALGTLVGANLVGCCLLAGRR